MNEQKQYVQVADGVYNCCVVSVKRADKSCGKDVSKHFVITFAVVRDDVDNAQPFYADVPILLTVGSNYDFYDQNIKKSVTRAVTVADSKAAWEYAERIFPDWKRHNEGLPANATLGDSFAWFDSSANGDFIVRAKLTNRPYGSEGKVAHNATLYALNANISESVDAQFEKSLKAIGVRFGGASKSAAPKVAQKAAPAAPSASKAAPKAAPAAPAAPTNTADRKVTKDDAWACYFKYFEATDPNGTEFWPKVERILGKSAANWETFNSDDWAKCVDEFASAGVGF